MIAHQGWDEFEIGSVLFSFNSPTGNVSYIVPEARDNAPTNSINTSVAHWRVEKPIFNSDHCINCFFCWIYCPDSSILSREKEVEKKGQKTMEQSMVGVDYVHCKGCAVCVDVCPTNPKSLLMIDTNANDGEMASFIANWPKKEEKKDN